MGKKILLVEDNEQNRYLIQYILEHNGYEVLHAETGAQAIEMAQQLEPDLILMDIQLPDMNGLEVTRIIRTSSAGKDIPVVAVTSFAMAGDSVKATDSGCSGYIEKPIDPQTFLREIEIFIKGEKYADD